MIAHAGPLRLAGLSWVAAAMAAGAVLAGAAALCLTLGAWAVVPETGESAGVADDTALRVMLVPAPTAAATPTPTRAPTPAPAPEPARPVAPTPQTHTPQTPKVDTPAPNHAQKPPPPRPEALTPSPAPAPQASPPAPAAQSAGTGQKAMADYAAGVMQRIRTTRPGPFVGQGAVTVGFAIGPDGTLATLRVLRSSGQSRLDATALDLIRQAAPFGRPPGAATVRYSYEFVAR